MFANVRRERERDWCRHVKVNITLADRQVEKEVCVCVCVCVCVLFDFHQVFCTLGTRLRIPKFCVEICKIMIVRDV